MKILINSTMDDPNHYVGIKIKDNITNVYFPYGYPINEIKSMSEQDQKVEIRNLLYSFIGTDSNEELKTELNLDDNDNYIYNCIYLIEDYLINGLFLEDKQIVSNCSNGKISWKKTLNKMPFINIIDNKFDSIYFKDIYKRKNIKEETLITKLEISALQIAKENIGFLFDDFSIPYVEINDPQNYIAYLKSSLSKIYIDKYKKIVESIINIIEHNGNNEYPVPMKLGTTSYHVVWENMLRKVYGILDESKYFPNTKYHLKGLEDGFKEKTISQMRPDLIFKPKDRNDYYIIDAKYYEFCETNRTSNLPMSESISKQIIYIISLEEQLKGEKAVIHSFFILPFDKNKHIDEFIPSTIKELSFKGFGNIESPKIAGKKYTIGLAFKDTRDLILQFNTGKKYYYDKEYKAIVQGYNDYLTYKNIYQ